jgi:iron complex outermembrane recepter protein
MQDARSGGLRWFYLGGILATAMLLVGFGATAMAQEQPPAQQTQTDQQAPKDQATPETEEQFKEEVVVTGTLIPRPTLEAMSPVATMDVQELAYQGTTRLEDMLTSLPMVFHAQNSTISNGASGTATIDLRYLGADRTLVLVDGRRLPSGDTGAISPDLNFIPAALVKRVDVLTGGASATYGADAVAGVVNFILDRDFEGMKFGIQGGGYQHTNNDPTSQRINEDAGFAYPEGQAWDGGNIESYFALGGKFAEGKGHASLYLDYRETAALLKERRDYLNCALGGDDPAGPYCSGSGTIPAGRFRVYTPDYARKIGDYVLDSTTGNTFRNRSGADVFNYGPYNYMQRPDERWAGGGFLNYEFNEHFQAYADVMLMDDRSDAQIAPSGSFGSVLQQINCDNPMLSPDQRAKICPSAYYPNSTDMASVIINRRSVEGGGRDDILVHQSFRLMGGVKGEINKTWNYDVYGLEAQTRVPEIYTHDFSYARIQDALIVDGNPNDPSTWHCRSGNAGCVPWNIFRSDGVTQEALNYVEIPLLSISDLNTKVASAKVTADLKDYGLVFPGASEGIGFAGGAEYRSEYLSFQPDLAYQNGDGAGQGGKALPVNGQYFVKELFTEFILPIFQGARGAEDLSLSLGYRYSDYNVNGGYSTYKAEANWAPTADFKFRTGYNRATRAPNVVELYQPARVVISGDLTADPCAGPTPGYTAAQCANSGVRADQYGLIDDNPAGQYNGRFSGSSTLQPEVADTMTLGIVITPKSLSGFTAAFDYYDIKIDQVISTLPGNNILTSCIETGDPALCAMVHRDIFGTLWMTDDAYVKEENGNFGQRDVQGIDANINYTLPVGNTFFNFNLIGSYMMKWELSNSFFSYDCAGYFGNTCGDPTPNWRHLFRGTWETNKATVSLAWRYVGAVSDDNTNSAPALYVPPEARAAGAGVWEMPAYNYFDIAATFNFGKNIKAMLGVNNIADKMPPLGAGYGGNDYGPGFHGTYDPYGRYVHSSIQFTF